MFMIRIAIVTALFVFLDMLWLSVIAKHLYIGELGDVLRLSQGSIAPRFGAVAMVYVAIITGIILFVLPKAAGDPLSALLWGAVFGFVLYGTYDFTNLAVLSKWTFKISVIDTVWGMVICGVTSGVAQWIVNLLPYPQKW